MNNAPKTDKETGKYENLNEVVNKIQNDLNKFNIVLLYGHNGTGKTRLSMAFKDWAKKNIKSATHFILMPSPKIFFIGIMI